jgi:Uma2 family endonuclease
VLDTEIIRPPTGDPALDSDGDEMGESGLQYFICHQLVGLLEFFFEESGRQMLVAGNQYMYWDERDPTAFLAPDVYVIPDEATLIKDIEIWRIWEHGGKRPCMAVEVVASDPRRAAKDYDPVMLAKYEALGVQELFRYDPHHGPGRRIGAQKRRLMTHWVQDERGHLRERPLRSISKMKSALFDFWLIHDLDRGLLLGTGPQGLSLWPSRTEAAKRRAEEEARRAEEEARRAEEEARRAEEEARRAEEEARRAEGAEAREAALRAEVEALRAQLAARS